MRKITMLAGLCLGWLVAACAAEPSPSVTPTPSRTPVPPTATTEFRLIPSWTPTASPLPSSTPTPRPTATPDLTLQPFFTAQPNYTPASGQGIATPNPQTSFTWLDRFSFASEVQPFLLFELRYDPLAWQIESVFTPAGLGYQLAHRSIDGCLLSQTTGGNASDEMLVEYTDETLGELEYYIGQATQEGELVFVTYCTSYAENPTCFIAYPGASERRCLAEVEGMLAGLTFLNNPRYTTAPNTWACRDEQNNPGLCQVSYSRPLNAFSLPAVDAVWAVGEDGLILRQEGTEWNRVEAPTDTTLYDMAFVDESHGWAAGMGGTILRWDGEDWRLDYAYTPPEDDPTGAAWGLYALDFDLPDDGWAAGAVAYPDLHLAPLLLHYNGLRWLPVDELPECDSCTFNAVLAVNSRDLWLGGGGQFCAQTESEDCQEIGRLWHWDGTAWSEFSTPGATWIYTLAQSPSGDLWAAGEERRLTPGGSSVQRGAVLRWDGGGWIPISLLPNQGGIYTLATLADGSLVASGDFTLLRSGRTWTYVATEIANFGWISDLEMSPAGGLFALTSTGFLFELTH